MEKNYSERLQNVLKESNGFKTDVYNILFKEHIETSDCPGEVLQAILEFDDEIGSEEGESSFFDKEKIQNTQNHYWPLLHEIIKTIVRENLEINAFYDKLYKMTFQSELFQTDDLTHAVLLEMISEGAGELPYFQIKNTLDLSQDDFSDAVDSIVPWLNRAMVVLNREFNTKTARISQIWNIAQELDSEKQIVFWTVVIGSIVKHSKDE